MLHNNIMFKGNIVKGKRINLYNILVSSLQISLEELLDPDIAELPTSESVFDGHDKETT